MHRVGYRSHLRVGLLRPAEGGMERGTGLHAGTGGTRWTWKASARWHADAIQHQPRQDRLGRSAGDHLRSAGRGPVRPSSRWRCCPGGRCSTTARRSRARRSSACSSGRPSCGISPRRPRPVPSIAGSWIWRGPSRRSSRGTSWRSTTSAPDDVIAYRRGGIVDIGQRPAAGGPIQSDRDRSEQRSGPAVEPDPARQPGQAARVRNDAAPLVGALNAFRGTRRIP